MTLVALLAGIPLVFNRNAIAFSGLLESFIRCSVGILQLVVTPLNLHKTIVQRDASPNLDAGISVFNQAFKMTTYRKPGYGRQQSYSGGDLDRCAHDNRDDQSANLFDRSAGTSSDVFGDCSPINPFFDPKRNTPSYSSHRRRNNDQRTHRPNRVTPSQLPRNQYPYD
jgi:hypothetical protein